MVVHEVGIWDDNKRDVKSQNLKDSPRAFESLVGYMLMFKLMAHLPEWLRTTPSSRR